MILGSFGLTVIDENLKNLLQSMEQAPTDALMTNATSMASALGLAIALGVGSYECFMMMLGRRGMDVMKILRIIIISLCISLSTYICDGAKSPGIYLKDQAHKYAIAEYENVKDFEQQVSDKQEEYLSALRKVQTELEMQKKADERTFWQSVIDGELDEYISDKMDEVKQNTVNMLQNAAVNVESTVTSWINAIIKFICELLFQISFYGLLVAQNLFLSLMKIFCPIAFAMSLAPPFRSAWSQWLTKFLSISLWGFVVYMILYYTCYIMEWSLNMDLKAYEALTKDAIENGKTMDWTAVKNIGMQSLGTTCMYVIGLLVGVFLLKFVPEVSSWLIPGGVSSGAGSMAGGSGSSAATMAVGGTTAVAGAAVGAAPAVAAGTKSITNTIGSDLQNFKDYTYNGGKLY